MAEALSDLCSVVTAEDKLLTVLLDEEEDDDFRSSTVRLLFAVVMAEDRLLILASGLALLSVNPPLFMEDTRLGLVRPEFSPEFDPKLRSMSGMSECGEVTMPNESQSSIFTSPVDGISIIAGLVSCLLDPPCSFEPASVFDMWLDAARLNLFLDSETD